MYRITDDRIGIITRTRIRIRIITRIGIISWTGSISRGDLFATQARRI